MVGEDGHRGWIYYVATTPERQRTGLGRQIMAAAEAWLANRGVWKVQLLIRDDNENVKRFYERLGYLDTKARCFQKSPTACAGAAAWQERPVPHHKPKRPITPATHRLRSAVYSCFNRR
jgi:RimJ/RimL family protein N-acetyltransferase